MPKEDYVENILVKDIRVDESFNSRESIQRSQVISLMKSIERDGLIQPVVVRPHEGGFDLVAGFRRMKAVEMLGSTHVSALVKDITYEKARFINMQENMNRKDLSILEEAQALRRLIQDFPNLTERQLCAELDISRGYLSPRLMLLNMPTQAQELAHLGFLGAIAIRDLHKFEDPVEI